MTTSLRAYLKVGVSCSISVVLYLSIMFFLSSKYLGFPVGLYNLFLKKKIMLYISYHLSTKDLRISLSLSHNRILTKTYKNLTITVLLTMSIAFISKQFCDNFFPALFFLGVETPPSLWCFLFDLSYLAAESSWSSLK